MSSSRLCCKFFRRESWLFLPEIEDKRLIYCWWMQSDILFTCQHCHFSWKMMHSNGLLALKTQLSRLLSIRTLVHWNSDENEILSTWESWKFWNSVNLHTLLVVKGLSNLIERKRGKINHSLPAIRHKKSGSLFEKDMRRQQWNTSLSGLSFTLPPH